MMTTDFYNKVANKFGGYHNAAKYDSEYPDDNPEQVFKEKLNDVSGTDKIALDIGCADGRFTLATASLFQKIIAIDLSQGMLAAARKLQHEKAINNVIFEEQNASKTTYPNNTFDVVYSRRGPTPYHEFQRVLKPGGYFVGINIGEKDCQPIKEVFGRGQNFGQWHTSTLEKAKQNLLENNFSIIFDKGYFYDEYYQSYEDLDLFLQGVPIFEDFDSEKDKKSLRDYGNKFITKKGIRLPRHRNVIVAQKK